MPESVFSNLSEDIVLNILYKLGEDPRDWARLACVSTKFSHLIRTVCCKTKCTHSIPAIVSDLFSPAAPPPSDAWASLYKLSVCCPGLVHSGVLFQNSDFGPEKPEIGDTKAEFSACKRRKTVGSLKSHMASGIRNLSREQGNKLLASRFKSDCLYICDWPGCIHVEEKRNYMVFRGIFKDFKQSRVWRTINDGWRSKIDVHCAFCSSEHTWDLHSSFCLRRYFGFHDDGEPVVRAYVCENGHVSGAWTDWPLYT